MLRSRLLTVLAVSAFLLVGCGGDSDDSPAAGKSTDKKEPTVAASCEGTKVTVTEVATGESATLDSAVAVSLQGGAAYTIYASDFEIDPESLSMYSNPEVPADGTLASIPLTIFNAEGEPEALKNGTEIPFTDEFGVLTFRVIVNKGERALGDNSGASGTVQLTSTGEKVCITVDYGDNEKKVAGTVEAAAKQF